MGNTKRLFTPEEVEILWENPFTKSVTPERIQFTYEFKEFFVKQDALPQSTAKKIFRAAGYDPDMLGRSRVNEHAAVIRRQARSAEGLKRTRGKTREEKMREFAEKDLENEKTAKAIAQLQEEIVHLEAEVNFLKKIALLKK